MLVNSDIATPCRHVSASELILLSDVLPICLCLFSLFYGSCGLQRTLCTTCVSVPNSQCIFTGVGTAGWAPPLDQLRLLITILFSRSDIISDYLSFPHS